MATKDVIPKDVMVDIETLSTATDALVLSVGARHFIADSGATVGPGLLVVPSFFEQVLLGRRIDRATQVWWAQQPPEAAQHWMAPERALSVRAALSELADYVRDCTRVWARGTHFDIAILDNLYLTMGIKSPWKYNAPRDVRSYTEGREIVRLPSANGVVDGAALPLHHPFRDCAEQIKDLWEHGLS